MSVRVEVQPGLFEWARARSGLAEDVFEHRFPKFEDWRSGTIQPTLKQLQQFAKKTYTPIGFFFLDQPPAETVPIPDFRTIADRTIGQGSGAVPTADLLDTV